ncbi:MAG: AAA family ATPase [Rhizobiaceae bacterium]|nr:AAA family ATPase [Rhizobiaceae bacterium]
MVHINGWPGSGKLTIGRKLAGMIDARMVDEHLISAPADMLFSRRETLNRTLRIDIRKAVFSHILRAPRAMSFVFTDSLADHPQDAATFENYRELAERRRARLVAVVVDCSEEENLRRLKLQARDERKKFTDPKRMRKLRDEHKLLRSERVELVEIDVTRLSAEQAAEAIAKGLRANRRH